MRNGCFFGFPACFSTTVSATKWKNNNCHKPAFEPGDGISAPEAILEDKRNTRIAPPCQGTVGSEAVTSLIDSESSIALKKNKALCQE